MSIKRYFLLTICFFCMVCSTYAQTGYGSLQGLVTDATTGMGISGATVSITGQSTVTDGSGNYSFAEIAAGVLKADFSGAPRSGTAPLTVSFTDASTIGRQLITASADGYQDYENSIFIEGGKTTTYDISLSPVLSKGQYRIVLNWGVSPSDMDLHLLTPEINGIKYSVSWLTMGSDTRPPFAQLDHDDQSGLGPETITIHQFYAGTYRCFVHNFSEYPDIVTSNGVVKIYDETGLVSSVQIPDSPEGGGHFWYVCDIDGSSGAVTVKNEIVTGMEIPALASHLKTAQKSQSDAEETGTVMEITSWQWDFDDDGVIDATVQNPDYTYEAAGEYTVSLTVSDGIAENMARKTEYISVSSGGDTTPPGSVSNLRADVMGNNSIQLDWNNPADSDYKGTVIQRKTTGYPINPEDGVRIYNGAGRSFIDTDLAAGTGYYYTAFAYDESGLFSAIGPSCRVYAETTGGTPGDGLRVSVSSVDATGFPTIKTFAGVVESVSLEPVTGLGKANFGVLEDGTGETVISVEEITAGSDATADIVFVFDVTGSMGDEIEGLKSRAQAFADALAARGVDYRLALVTFGDKVEDVYDFTGDVSVFKNWIESLSAHGGSDYKENALEGLARGSSLSFRAVTQRMSILITDADFHEAGESGVGTTSYTTESMVAHLTGKGIMNHVVGPDQEPHHQLAENTGGLFFDITGDFQAIVDLIGNIISSQYLITYSTHNSVIDNTWRNVTVNAVSGSKTGTGTGRYYIGTAISNVSGFYAYAISSDKVVCRWYNPSAESFAGVVVVRKTGVYPTGPTDGTVIYEGTGSSCVDTGLMPLTQYHYAAFAYNYGGFYSEGGSGSRDRARTWADGTERPTSWTRLNSGTDANLQAVCAVDSFYVYTVGEGGAFLRTADGGNTWEAVFRPSAPNFFSLDFISRQVGWSVGANTLGNAENLKTISRGNGWTPWASSDGQPIYSNDFVNDMMGWNVGGDGKIEKTVNGGGSWTAQPSGVTENLMSVCFINTKTGWTAGSNGTILKTTNSGVTWVKLTSGTTSRINDIHFQDAFLGWAVTDNGYLLRTTDGGNAWSSERLSDTFLSAVNFSDPYNGVAVGGNGKIFKTSDGGADWEEDKTPVETHLRDVELPAPGYGWAVGDNGTIIKLAGGTVSDCGMSGYRLTLNSIDAEAFPNIKVFASVVDTGEYVSVTGLGADHFDLQENSLAQTPITVAEMGKTSGARADIAFVFDVTGSMGDEIAGLKERAVLFAESLVAKGVDYRLGLVTFHDDVSEVHDFTDDVNEFKAWIDGLRASGVSDTKENALEGLARMAKLSFRSTTQRIGVLITDADYHERGETGNGTTTYTTRTIIDLLNDYGIVLNVVGPDMDPFHQLADLTSGLYYDITGDFGAIVDNIGTFLSSQYVISYTSSNPVPDATLRHVFVTVENADKGGCDRGSYYVGTSRLFLSPNKIVGIADKNFVLDVYIESVLNLGLCNFKLSFDASKIQVADVAQGDFLTRGGASLNFIPETDNTGGSLEVSATRINSTTGVNGSGKLCSVTFHVITSNCAGNINFTSNNLRTPENLPISVSTSGATIDAAVTSGLLGDFDKDLDIDTRDFALLSTYWKPSDNANGDIGPAAGVPPAMTPSPDGVVNFEDLFVFARMWNWFHAAETGTSGPRLAKKSTGLEWQLRRTGDKLFADLAVNGLERLAMGHFRIGYDQNSLAVKNVSAGQLLNQGQTPYALLSEKSSSGLWDIAFARLSTGGRSGAIEGDGILFSLELERTGMGRAGIGIEHVDLRSADNQCLTAGACPDLALEDAGVPEYFDLLPNYPNPFNSRTQIGFQVPEKSRVRLEIFNLLGQPVRTLVDDRYDAGRYRALWDGVDENGRMVVSGIYILRMTAGPFRKTREMLFLK